MNSMHVCLCGYTLTAHAHTATYIVIHMYTNIIITYHEPQQCFMIGSIKFPFLIIITQYNKIRHTVVILLSSNVKN